MKNRIIGQHYMKILLLGEFSGLFNNLKDGLVELGHEAYLASSGDGFKKISSDIDLSSSLPGIAGRLHEKVIPFLCEQKLMGFDVVQLINPFAFYQPFYPASLSFFKRIKSGNGAFFLSAAGDDSFFWHYGRERLRYGPFDDFLKYDIKKKRYYMESRWALKYNQSVANLVHGIIPIMHEYEISYRGHEKLLDSIPIPLNIDKIEYRENVVGNKVVVFHGLNRYGFKGTRHVEKAFEILKEKYPGDLELIIAGKMPLVKYLQVMQRSNVVLDQVYSHSCGMNAIYAMAMGKVVIGGAEPESLKNLGVNSTPVINVRPSVDSIVKNIEYILDNRSMIFSMGFNSRKFVEVNHKHTAIAQRYIKSWARSR